MTEYPTHLIRRIRHKAFGVEEKAVLMNLADRMRSVSDVVWPSVETIALDCGMKERAARYVIGWLVLVGALVEVQDGRRTRSFRIDFERLDRLPEHLPPRSRKEKDRHPVPPAMHPEHPNRHAVQDAQTGTPCPQGGTTEQGDRHPVPPRPAPGAPEGSSEGTKKEPVKEPIAARVPRRSNDGPDGQGALQFDTRSSTSVPATDAARPEAAEPPVETMAPTTPPSPVKGNVGAKSKGASKTTKSGAKELTPEQSQTFRRTTDVFWAEFQKAKGEKPIMDLQGRDRQIVIQFLAKLQWDGSKAREIIENAFSQAYYRERFANFDELLKNTTRYQGTPKSERRASSGQVFANPDRWDSPLEDIQS